MVDMKYISSHVDEIKKVVAQRNVKADIDLAIDCYHELCREQKTIDDLRAESNRIAETIKMGSLSSEEKQSLMQRGKQIKQILADSVDKLEVLGAQLRELSLTIPNLLAPDTPLGHTDQENTVVRTFKTPTAFPFKPKDHVELGKSLDILDFEAGTPIAGSKFYFVKNEGVLLELALEQLAFKIAMAHGYIPLQTPDLAYHDILIGSGYSPRGPESNVYCIEGSNLCLIATAEIPVGGLHSNQILQEDQLPLKYVAKSHCFRVEAGGGGKESKGLYRVHQFTKIELYQFSKPEQSDRGLEEIVGIEEEIYKALDLPYRVVRVCAGDLGAPAYKKYDIEAWMPSKGEMGEYGEITSASNCTDFQARRLNIRYKDKSKKNHFVHTLNGTAIALSRTFIAIIENYQQADGSVLIPKALIPYMPVERIKSK